MSMGVESKPLHLPSAAEALPKHWDASGSIRSVKASCGLIPKKEMRYYVYLHMASSVAALEQQTRGSAQQNLSQQIVADFPTTLPDDETLARFDKAVHLLFARWIANLNESRTLTALRDALLPKLLSGELRVPAAAQLTAAKL